MAVDEPVVGHAAPAERTSTSLTDNGASHDLEKEETNVTHHDRVSKEEAVIPGDEHHLPKNTYIPAEDEYVVTFKTWIVVAVSLFPDSRNIIDDSPQ